MVFALEHQYTAAGLTPSLLKGADKTLYRQLDAVCKLADARLHFGQVSRHLFLYADDGNFGYGRYDYHGWSGDYDDLNIGEVIEDEIIVDGWKDDTGKPVALDALRCEVSQLVCATDVEQWTPTQQDYEGYTGNAGNTLERWYHKSAIALWDRRQHFEVITQMGLKFAVSQLRQMRTQLVDLDDDDLEQACDDCQQLAESIICHWPDRTHDRGERNRNDLPWLKRFANELPKFDDPDLIAKFFQTVARQDWSVDLDRCVVDSLKRMGPAEILPLLRELIEFEPPPNRYGNRMLVGLAVRDAAWLLKIATTNNHCGVAADELQGLLSLAPQKLIADTKEVESSRYRDSDPTTSAWSLLCKAVMVAGCQGLAALLQLPRTCQRVFDLRTFQVSAAIALRDFAQKRLGQVPEALEQWIGELRQILQQATREKPQPPSTLSRPSETGCDCQYCVQLSEFLKHPEQKRTRIAARADRRDHLTQVIHAKKLDVTTKLVRTGSPYSLELTKTTASYQADLKRFQADLKLLKALE